MPRIRSLKPEFFHDRKLARTTSITPPPAPIAEPRANESAPDANEPAPSTETSVLLYVAGGRGQVAGSKGPRETRPRKLGADESVTAQNIVDAYIQGCRSINAPDPEGNLCGKVGKQAKAMLTKHDPNLLMQAAFNMGAAGWSDLAVQIQRDAAAARPRNTTGQSHRELIASYEDGGQQ
jgi:hypothetical protein